MVIVPEHAVLLGSIPNLGLVALPLDSARRRVELELALGNARTWAEARALLTDREADDLAERFEDVWDEEGGPPSDADLFDLDAVWGLDDGEWPGWPPREALGWVPDEVQALGRVVQTTHSGPYLVFEPDAAARVAEAFRQAGYDIERDDALVDAACGGYGGTSAHDLRSDA